MDERTEQPADEAVASPLPPFLFWTMWISVFCVVAWGLMLLFGRRPWDGTSRGQAPDPPPQPVDAPTTTHVD